MLNQANVDRWILGEELKHLRFSLAGLKRSNQLRDHFFGRRFLGPRFKPVDVCVINVSALSNLSEAKLVVFAQRFQQIA
jgi:hypothetical protein